MIKYNIGDIPVNFDMSKFLCLIYDEEKIYNDYFDNIQSIYKFIDMNIKNISMILFDGVEYILEDGKLHNLYGAAIKRYVEKDELNFSNNTMVEYFYIDGKLVVNRPYKGGRGCRNKSDFQEKPIYHYEELTNIKSGEKSNGKYYRRKIGIDFDYHIIKLKTRIVLDTRKKKIKKFL